MEGPTIGKVEVNERQKYRYYCHRNRYLSSAKFYSLRGAAKYLKRRCIGSAVSKSFRSYMHCVCF